MLRRAALIGLLVWVAAGAAWTLLRDPCGTPVAYRLERVDERFGMSREDVTAALQAAEAVWATAAGREMFVPQPGAPLPINLVYDERQQTTQRSATMLSTLDQARGVHAKVTQAYAFSRRTWDGRMRDYQDASSAYEQRVREFSARVQDWNRRGGAPADVRADLERERTQLDEQRQDLNARRVALDELAVNVNRLADHGNTLAANHERGAATFNALYGAPRRFHQGEFNGREISVFEFQDARDLILVLAHELGHARGLGHVDDPTAIMHAVGSRQNVAQLAAAPGDIAELRRVCGR